MSRRVIVVGAGAAGIIAAWRAAELGARVLLIEKTARLGTKILISGGGKCNVAHDGDMRTLLAAFRKPEAEFIRPACYRFPNTEIMKIIRDGGLHLTTRPDGRVFPTEGNAKDVVAILKEMLLRAGVEIRLDCPVTGLVHEAGCITGVTTATEVIPSSRVVLAAGGSSYPGTGTTGDGWPWARELGHRVVKVRAALAPIYQFLDSPTELLPASIRSGVAIRDCLLKARPVAAGSKEVARWQGDLLLTHHGISGPCALGISREVAEQPPEVSITLFVDFIPGTPHDQAVLEIQRWAESNPRKQFSTLLETYMPARLVPAVLAEAKISPESTVAGCAVKVRNRLVETLKNWSLGLVRHVPLEKGEVVAGGISLDEVDPRTMLSSKCAGLYLCGEVLDVAGPVGGYNLQAAFATGFVAGDSAATEPTTP